mgnify:CR=1 FL=1
MALYQLPPLKNDKQFEEFICDLFNEIENTNSYQNTDFQTFGVTGQNQGGIDILSPKTKTVIQCKVKDLRKQDEVIRNSLLKDFNTDVQSAFQSGIEFERFILVSTFRDDTYIQRHATVLRDELRIAVAFYYWGWDTLSRYAEQYENILVKYFPKFIPKPVKAPKRTVIDLPYGALGKDLLRKNYISYLIKRYGDWKQLELNKNEEKFNWASFNRHIMNKYKAPGINHIPVVYFEELSNYLKGKIDKTIFGKNKRAKGHRNYSPFEDHALGIMD